MKKFPGGHNNAVIIVADESFFDVKHELLLSFVERSSACIRKEATLFQAVDRWAAKRCEEGSMTVNGENKRTFKEKELLEQFRFSLPRQVSFQMCLCHRNFVFNWSYPCFYAVYIRFHPRGDSAYERGGDASRKFWIKPLKETNPGVAQAFFWPLEEIMLKHRQYVYLDFWKPG